MGRRERFIIAFGRGVSSTGRSSASEEKTYREPKFPHREGVAISSQRCAIQILTKLCDMNIHARWITEAGLKLQ